MSFVKDSSYSKSAEIKPQERLEMSNSAQEISCAGATYGSEVVEGLEVQRGKKILGTEGRPDFDTDLRREHRASYAIQTRNYGATHHERNRYQENNNNRYEPEPDY